MLEEVEKEVYPMIGLPKDKVQAFVEYPPKWWTLTIHFWLVDDVPKGPNIYFLEEIICNL